MSHTQESVSLLPRTNDKTEVTLTSPLENEPVKVTSNEEISLLSIPVQKENAEEM